MRPANCKYLTGPLLAATIALVVLRVVIPVWYWVIPVIALLWNMMGLPKVYT